MGTSRGRGPSLAERTAAATGAGGAAGAGAPGTSGASSTGAGGTPGAGQSTPRETSGRHCWVVDPPEAPGRWPGLLAEWRRATDGLWEGRVVYAVAVRDRCVLVEGWLGVHRLEQV
jgi:hypothetical protein